MLFQAKFLLDNIIDREKGQGLLEYALVVLLVAVVVMVALTALGPQIAVIYNDISTSFTGA